MLIIPTGIGAAIGGYAGDALPVARAMASVCDCLITHPNVLNGAQLYWPLPQALYVEGYGLDQFAAGAWGLRPVRQNCIGLVFDQAIEPELRLRHLQAADAARATLGLSLTDAVITDAPLGVRLETAISGATWGTIAHPDSLLRAVEAVIKREGATAIAVVARFPDHPESAALAHYRQGQGVDPLAGAEAVISHLVVRTFGLPCAHAPALSPLPITPDLSPRAAAEELGYTFLPSVLAGLSRAPQFVRWPKTGLEPSHLQPQDLWRDQVNALVVPESACGGSAVLHLNQTNTTLITVAENRTTMQADPATLKLTTIQTQTYLEALGVLVALRAGIDPITLTTQVNPVACLHDVSHHSEAV
nr:DUF3326 domain-containing protein [Petrachloros mirabilis]